MHGFNHSDVEKKEIEMKMIRPIVILLVVLAAGAAQAGVVMSGFTDTRYNSCSLCDGYMNWAVWKTEGTSWYDDAFFGTGIESKIQSDDGSGAPAGVINGTERYVYMYQAVNVDQITTLEARLEELDVNDPLNCFTGVGWFTGMTFEDAGNTPIEGQGNGNYTMAATDPPSFYAEGDFPDSSTSTVGGSITSIGHPTAGTTSGAADIDTAVHTSTGLVAAATANVVDPSSSQIAQAWTSAAAFGTQVTSGPIWRWDVPEINLTNASSVVFAVSNAPPVYRPANIKGQGGPGAAGDAPSPCVPEPSSLLIAIGLVLASGGAAWRRRRKQA